MIYRAIEHTAIATPDPEKLAAWYVEHLGFRLNYRLGPNVFVRAPDGGMLEFVPSDGARAVQGMTDPGIRHLAIAVDDFDEAYRLLKVKGVRIVSEPSEVRGNRLVFFTDGDGNYLHLVHRPAPLP